ncbi:50S ribosomal protein L32 [Patescibacteria group bacterium]|nr:50S ribosomal protein L32 [Patescibacteria group bacterium]MBU4162369.1 50S ribosomal protein L32 [Patescibacteria group bacterium]
MGVPKQKKTKSRRNQRRQHIFLKQPSLSVCPKCGKPVARHTLCKNCGYYNGRMIVDVLKKLDKKEKKKKEKEIKEGEKGQEKPLTMEGLSKQ